MRIIITVALGVALALGNVGVVNAKPCVSGSPTHKSQSVCRVVIGHPVLHPLPPRK